VQFVDGVDDVEVVRSAEEMFERLGSSIMTVAAVAGDEEDLFLRFVSRERKEAEEEGKTPAHDDCERSECE